jgi:hypothetical protein
VLLDSDAVRTVWVYNLLHWLHKAVALIRTHDTSHTIMSIAAFPTFPSPDELRLTAAAVPAVIAAATEAIRLLRLPPTYETKGTPATVADFSSDDDQLKLSFTQTQTAVRYTRSVTSMLAAQADCKGYVARSLTLTLSLQRVASTAPGTSVASAFQWMVGSAAGPSEPITVERWELPFRVVLPPRTAQEFIDREDAASIDSARMWIERLCVGDGASNDWIDSRSEVVHDDGTQADSSRRSARTSHTTTPRRQREGSAKLRVGPVGGTEQLLMAYAAVGGDDDAGLWHILVDVIAR